VDVTCQICTIHGHPASDCWWRFKKDDSDDEDSGRGKKGAHIASYGVDSNWYSDTGATDHITSELNKLTTSEKYKGQDRVHTADGNGMVISHVGHSMLHTPHSTLHLNNILHIPTASKNLLSVHKLTLDNDVYIEFHPWFFLIKDRET
jgi:histone deacetylase 1/2